MTTTMKSSSVTDAAKQIAKAKGIDVDVVREAIEAAIKLGPLDNGYQFLSFEGVLPVHLPDGTRVAILPDIHVPAHNKLVMFAVKKALKDYNPHILILIGDALDVFSLTKWPVPAGIRRDLNSELQQGRRLVDELARAAGCFWTFYIMGNHEDRIWRYLMDMAPHLASIVNVNTGEKILSVPSLLGYKPGDPVTFIFDKAGRGGYGGALYVNDDMEFHHGFIVRPTPGASPRADAQRTGRSTGTGHTHRAGMNAYQTMRGEVVSMEFGHLVDPDHSYLAYANILNNWHHDFGLGLVVDGKIHVEQSPIKKVTMADGKDRWVFRAGGKLYVSSDR